MNKGKVVIGVLAGMAAGALLGILFAPDKGSVTRQKISRKSREYVDGVKEKVEDVIDNISERFDAVKEGFIKSAGRSKPEATA